MEIYNKEFNFLEKVKCRIRRNDFDELGSILEIEYILSETVDSASHLIVMSFYDYNQVQIAQNQLILLTNQESIFFDNVLIINTNSNKSVLLKLLNNEIFYTKIYISTERNWKTNCTNLNSTNLLDIFHLELLDMKTTTGMKQKFAYMCNNNNPDKNEHINLIIQEMNQVNLSLIKEKEHIEKCNQQMRNKEEQLNSMITNFKKEMLIHSDRFYNEALVKFNLKICDIQKKLQVTENNVMNKCKLIKEKLVRNSKKNNHNVFGVTPNDNNFKEKIANLEIRNKFLEDTVNNFKVKLAEKEDLIKSNFENEEKLNKLIKKIKEENISYQIKIKNLISESEGKDSEKENNIKDGNKLKNKLISISNSNQINNKSTLNQCVKQIKNKFEINKTIVSEYLEYFIIEILTSSNTVNNSLNNKESLICSTLILHLAINPIHLFKKFPMALPFVLRKIFSTGYITENKKILNNTLIDLLNCYTEIKKIFVLNDNNIKNYRKVKPILELNSIDGVSLNEVLLQKIIYFLNFFEKSEKKYLEKNNYSMFKIINIANFLIKIILMSDIDGIKSNIQYILTKIIYGRDYFSINYLFNLNYFELLINLITELDIGERDRNEMFLIFLNSFLYLFSLDDCRNLLERKKYFVDLILENKILTDLIENYINKHDKKFIIFAGILSTQRDLKNKLKINLITLPENLEKKEKELLSINLENII